MTIPTMQDFFVPVLKAFRQVGVTNAKTALPQLRNHFGLTDEEMEEMVPSGTRGRVLDRADWAIFHLMKAGLIERPARGFYKLSSLGRSLADEPGVLLDMELLSKYPLYQEFLNRPEKTNDLAATTIIPKITADSESLTPEETMIAAQSVLDTALRDNLLAILKDIHPVRFERLILDLLTAMGYGGGNLSNSQMTKNAGDGGIDGIIHEDALGLDAVYIQAKRYAPENKVGRPAIQQFVGSLNGEGATKGVFVTTSDFSAEARAFLGKVQHRIVLINGQELARLMIRHGVGVRDRTSYVVRSVDEDYFSDLNGG